MSPTIFCGALVVKLDRILLPNHTVLHLVTVSVSACWSGPIHGTLQVLITNREWWRHMRCALQPKIIERAKLAVATLSRFNIPCSIAVKIATEIEVVADCLAENRVVWTTCKALVWRAEDCWGESLPLRHYETTLGKLFTQPIYFSAPL